VGNIVEEGVYAQGAGAAGVDRKEEAPDVVGDKAVLWPDAGSGRGGPGPLGSVYKLRIDFDEAGGDEMLRRDVQSVKAFV